MRALALACALMMWPASTGAAPNRANPGFWDRVIAQKDHEIEAILTRVRQLHERASQPVTAAQDEVIRKRLLDDARGMLRHALTLNPDHAGALEMLAYVEEASGRVKQALELYQRLAHQHPGHTFGELCLRHGLLLARTSELDLAASTLHTCLELPGKSERLAGNTAALVHLANLHAHQGRINAATSLLEHHTASQPADPLALFALAVTYDKDEQRSRAFEILDQLKAQHQGILALTLSRSFEHFDFVPAVDQHYYLALLHETTAHLAEAREEWHNYLRSGDQARYPRRARQHLEAIDAMLVHPPKSTTTRRPRR